MIFARDILIGFLTALVIGAVLLWADVGQAQAAVCECAEKSSPWSSLAGAAIFISFMWATVRIMTIK